mgnify:CR=1 FL=1
MKAERLAAALRCCTKYDDAGCQECQFEGEQRCVTSLKLAAADELDELSNRCARYAEEIAVLQEKQKWVNAAERLPEYGVSVLAVASGKAKNITLRDTAVFATFWDAWELDDYPQAEGVTVKWWRPMVESPEEVEHDG